MDTLQISPVVGFKPAAAPAGSPGGEAHHAHSDSKSTSAPPPVLNPNGQTQDQVVVTQHNAARAAEQRAAEAKAEEAKKAAQAAADSEKALDLKVGLVSGSSDKVFVDIVDPKLNRTIYRIFGPPAGEAEKPQPDTSTSDAKAADAYTRTSAPHDHPASVKTDA
jgi:hypothetical protein